MTFEIPARVIFDMEIEGAPLPPGVSTPNNLAEIVMITCSEDDALAMDVTIPLATRNSPAITRR